MQNKTYSDTAKAHVSNLVYVQQFCARCEEIELSLVNDAAGEGTHFGMIL